MNPIYPRHLRATLTANWPIKVTALVLAALLWAVTEAEEPTTQLVPVNLAVAPPEGRVLSFRIPPVQALYAGSSRELIKLFASPPTIRVQLPDTISGASYSLALSTDDLILGRDADVQAQDVQPRTINLILDDVASRTVPVIPLVSIRPDSGFAVFGGVAVIPASVAITGPRGIVEQIDTLRTIPIELTRVTAPIRRGVEIDTTSLGVVRLSRHSVVILAEVGRISERVVMGVPVRIRGQRGISWTSEPPAVTVTLSGPANRLAALTRDSIQVIASPQGNGAPETVRLRVSGPLGIGVAATRDSAVVQRRRSD